MQTRSKQIRQQGRTIAFVPTMGFLHDGHLSLLREGSKLADVLVLSIFVNPTQFGPNEDLEKYPKSMERDCALAEKENADIIFTPQSNQLYPVGYQTYVELESLPNNLCGLSRPTHFKGVATIVAKLFNIVIPHVAVFGEKDFQQLAVIRQMASDLNFDIKIIGAPTVREPDGLAMSSRNTYLSNAQRKSAICLYRSLRNADRLIQNGERSAFAVLKETRKYIESHPETDIDYISICDPATLEDVTTITGTPVLMAMAVKVGQTRLIDNMLLNT